jgi:tRNA(Ile2) C34 agmatinyltransferase TiaS
MKIYVGFDDTDVAGASRGTGKLARWFCEYLPDDVEVIGVVRQQLPRLPDIPFTSNNSSACVIIRVAGDVPGEEITKALIETARKHIEKNFIPGSDPGLCVTTIDNQAVNCLIEFGRKACSQLMTQKDAVQAAQGAHLSGHGGTNDGIIGAAAGVGLTISGWSGRFIEYGNLRGFESTVTVSELEKGGILALSVDRDALVPASRDLVDTRGWLRPRLWGNRAVLPVNSTGPGKWRSIAGKRKE